MPKNTLIVAHRGISSLYPENTLIAFRKAMELGADFIELDIQASRDGELVVIHDSMLDRTTEGKGNVCQYSLKEIKKYSAGKWFSPSFEKEKVPTLQEVFELTKKQIKLRIEIKQPGIEKKLLDLIQRYEMTDQVVCGSFFFESITQIRRLNPFIPVTFIASFLEREYIKELLAKNINMIDMIFCNLTPDLLKDCHSYGFAIDVWTVNEEKELQKALNMGIAAITTNYPQRLKKLLEGQE